jgi:1-acyl-sn-glycerol-3-phosphate acyltransferase
MGKIYLYTGFFIFGLAMVLVFPIIAIGHFGLPDRLSEKVKLLSLKIWAASFFTFGIRFRQIRGGNSQNDWPESPVILIANHNSLLDTPALFLVLKRFAFPLAKIELTRPFLFGQLCKWLTLPVDRNSQESRARSYEDMKNVLKNGQSLLIFPEGKTNKSPHRFQKFESGAFRLAFDLGVPIAPALIHNSRHCLAATSPMTLKPGTIKTELGPLFWPQNFRDSKSLLDAVTLWYESSSYQLPPSGSKEILTA